MTHDFICSWFMGHQHFRMRLAVGMAKAKFRGKDSNCQRLGSNKRPWCGRSMANFHLRHGAGSCIYIGLSGCGFSLEPTGFV